MKELNKTEFQELVIASDRRVVVDFFATWCGPCKMLGPVFEKVAQDHPEIDFYKVNVDDERDLAGSFGVMSIPTLICFEKGEEIRRNVGSMGRPALEEFATK